MERFGVSSEVLTSLAQIFCDTEMIKVFSFLDKLFLLCLM